jgi:phage shock protein PspC (stress-responsive transcriptional regulator)
MDNSAPAKSDNLFGICHALGESFGVNPLVLRLGFAGAFVLDFKIALLAYAAGGIAVVAGALVSRPWGRKTTRA